MIALALILAAAGSITPATGLELELNAQDRRALIIGLERRVGGKFVLNGIQDAGTTCAQTRACLTTADLLASSRQNPAIASAASVGQLLRTSSVGDEAPVAMVSVRSARWQGSNLIVRTAVYDRAAARWTTRDATISHLGPSFNDGAANVRVLLSWLPVTE